MRKRNARIKPVESDAGGWTPVLRGKVYCSPRCGGGCTRAAFDAATKKANALAKRMGEGWEPVVWENLGWHYRIERGPASIYSNYLSGKLYGYWCSFMTAKQFTADAKEPEDALGFAIQDARTFARRVEADCSALT